MIDVIGNVKDGTINLPSRFREWVLRAYEGKEIRVTVKEYRDTRSDRQNAYYWGVVVPHLVAGFVSLGNSWLNPQNKEHQEMIHEILKERFLANGVELVMGSEVIKTKPTTTKADTMEMHQFIERVRMFAMETMGVYVPEPNEIFV
jgi:hypothetical protein